MLANTSRLCALACAGWVIAGCTEPDADPVAPTSQPPVSVEKPGKSGAASERIRYQARLAPVGDSRSRGMVRIEVVGGYLTVSVHAAGVARLQHIPQHIHLNPTCDPGGNILINLDETLSVPGEGPGVGTAYPMSNPGGVVNYYASRSLSDLLAAVNTHSGAGLTSVEALLAWLNLDERNAHMHVSDGPPFPAVNCGEIERAQPKSQGDRLTGGQAVRGYDGRVTANPKAVRDRPRWRLRDHRALDA